MLEDWMHRLGEELAGEWAGLRLDATHDTRPQELSSDGWRKGP